MFSQESDNKKMLFGAYKKLKSYYHYNKNFLLMRKKIASFEFDSEKMNLTLDFLAKIMKNPFDYSDKINDWINSIDYYVLPKAFKENRNIEDRFVLSSLSHKSVSKVNFFIDMPIELHLLETVWTLIVAKIAFDNGIIQKDSYGNVIDNELLFTKSKNLKESIRFQKRNLFKIYFPQYCNCKNNAIDAIEKYKNSKNMVLLSMDIKNFYYSIHWKFDKLIKIIPDKRLEEFEHYSSIIELIFKRYTQIISVVRNLSQNEEQNEYILPIGLFSSMLLSNLFMYKYDISMKNNKNVLYYGRYVDDILILLNTGKSKFDASESILEELLILNNIVSRTDSKDYCLPEYNELLIQKEKLKLIYFERKKCSALLAQLRKTKIIPSQMNIIPSTHVKIDDFEEVAYALNNFSIETKIRDIGKLEINKFKLSLYMSELVRGSRFNASNISQNNRTHKPDEKIKIINFFSSSNAIEYSIHWINALYYILLTSNHSQKEWNLLKNNIRLAIKTISVDNIEDIKDKQIKNIKTKMKKDLNDLFDICISTALAVNPVFSRKEKKEILDNCYKIRNANLFNHYLVSFSLMNYSDEVNKDVDFSNMNLSSLKEEYFKLYNARKMKLSPRFIHFEELFHYSIIRSIVFESSPVFSDKIIKKITKQFLQVNQIESNWAKPLSISINEDEKNKNYNFIKIKLNNKTRNLKRIRVAVANIKLDIDSCCMGLNNTPVIRNRNDFISFLNTSYVSSNEKVDYLLFPEFYMPISWIQDVLSFTRKTGTTIISGMQYVYNNKGKNKHARNLVCIFTRVKSGQYNASCVFAREKNNYAPLEKKLLATKGYEIKDRKVPIYTCIDDGQVRFGVFLCYEFTDICARALFKDEVDMMFIPENNSDTTYFSNIIETMTRDIHAIMVQSNTSHYGDSRISGPYSRDQRNIVQIKGGDNDSLIIGTINIEDIRKSRKDERNLMEKEINDIFSKNKLEKHKKYQELKGKDKVKIAKLSARTFF